MSLEIRDIDLHYRKRQVLHQISFALEPGEFCALLGPNGSGKSTLTKALLGLAPVSGGSVLFEGEDLLQLSRVERAKRVAYVPQSSPVPFDLRVYDAVLLGRSPYAGVRYAPADHQAALQALEKLDLLELSDRYVNELSGGQLQRVLIARALAQETKILLLDEPTSALDIHHQLTVMELVRELARERGIIVVIVLHDIAQAARYAQRIVVMRQGTVAADGTPSQAITPAMLAQVYGVEARVEQCSHGFLQIMVDRAIDPHARSVAPPST